MTTVSEIADAIRAVGERLKNQMTTFGWSNEQPFSQIVGATGIAVSAGTVDGYA